MKTLFFALLCLSLAMLPEISRAQTSQGTATPVSLKNLSLEDLMNVQVTSVTRYPERLQDAPSAIQVVTSDDILMSGATSLPEALRLAGNLDVAQENSHDWAISARGFNANLADKLLVLIDGRAVYTPLYGGVLWNVQDYLLEDVDRIEVISGPGGTQWGANAVNGVINITTKSAKDTQGLYFKQAAGGELRDQTDVRYGTTLAPGVYARIYGGYSDRGSEVLSSGVSADDSWNMRRGGFRVDSAASADNPFTIQGDIYSGTEFLGSTGDEALSGHNLLGRWTHLFSDDSNMSLTAYYDETYLSQPYLASPPSPPFFSGFPASHLQDDLDTVDVDFQHTLGLPKNNQFIWGLSYRFTHETDKNQSIVRFLPEDLDQTLVTGFAQDELALGPAAHLTFGSKIEHNDYTGIEVEPSIRLLVNITPKQSLWAAVSRAVRTPSRYDRNLSVPTGLVNAPAPYVFPVNYLEGSQTFDSERLTAYELGYRAQVDESVSGSLSFFYNDYSHLRSVEATPTTAVYPFPYPVVFENELIATTYGVEFSGDWQVTDKWLLHGSYDLLREHLRPVAGFVDAAGGYNETADPQHQLALRSSFELSHDVQLDGIVRWLSSYTIGDGPTNGPLSATVPGYWELDAHLAWQVTNRIELAIAGQNLLHSHHLEYGYPGPSTEYIRRTVYGKLTLRY